MNLQIQDIETILNDDIIIIIYTYSNNLIIRYQNKHKYNIKIIFVLVFQKKVDIFILTLTCW
jgi:hypothetical protein